MLEDKQRLFDNLIWLDAKEAASYLRISVNALRIKACRGEIPKYKLGRTLRFKKVELDNLLESSLTGGFYDN
jgi:excisionase family DNA binding protein